MWSTSAQAPSSITPRRARLAFAAYGSIAVRAAGFCRATRPMRYLQRSIRCPRSSMNQAGDRLMSGRQSGQYEHRTTTMAHTLSASTSGAPARSVRLDSDAVMQARIELAACFQLAAQRGLEEGVCNHFSAMVPGHDALFFVNPYGYAFSEMTASRLLVCDLDGHVVDGEGAPEATAFYIHARLHRLQPRIKAAFHTHMPNATALCLLEGPPLLWLGQTALKFYGRTAVDERYNGLALDNSEGDRIAN